MKGSPPSVAVWWSAERQYSVTESQSNSGGARPQMKGRTAWEGDRGNQDRGDKMGRQGGWPKPGQETLIDKWRGERRWSTRTHAHNIGVL